MPKLHVVHYATSNPFSQYVQLTNLSASQVRELMDEFEKLRKEGIIHSYLVEPCCGSEVLYSALIQQLADLVTPTCYLHHLSSPPRLTNRAKRLNPTEI